MSERNQHGETKANSPGYTMLRSSSKCRQSIIWMALPNGRNAENNKLKLSVAVAPRLQVLDVNGLPVKDEKIMLHAGFPDFIDWPAWVNSTLLKHNKFEIEFQPVIGSSSRLDAAPQRFTASVVSSAPESSLWQTVFPKDTIVSTFVPELNLGHLMTKLRELLPNYRTLDDPFLENVLRRVYSNIALANAVTPPSIRKLIDPKCFGKVIELAARHQGLDMRRIEAASKIQDLRTTPSSVFGLPSGGKTQAMSLHVQTKLGQDTGATPSLLPLVENASVESAFQSYFEKQPADAHRPLSSVIARYDFHQILSFLRDYREVLRWLGLVIDLEVDDPKIQGQVKVRLIHNNLGSVGNTRLNSKPWTRCALSAAAFFAQPGDGTTVQDGMLTFDNKDLFSPGEIDTDGAARKTVISGGSMTRKYARETGNDGENYPLSSLRTKGLGMLMSDRVNKQIEKFERAHGLEKQLFRYDLQGKVVGVNDDCTLFAEDIMRGFRVDVEVNNGQGGVPKWHSLCRRKMEYHFGDQVRHGNDPFEEGTITTGLFKKTNSKNEKYEMLSTLFNWDGWSSLCVPRDGSSTSTAERVQTGLFMKAIPSQAPKTLPLLRFGWKYRFRARIVDLAGNSLQPDISEGRHTSKEIVFRRFEPVATPILVKPSEARAGTFTPSEKRVNSAVSHPGQSLYTPGESLETLVIRSNYDTHVEESCIRSIAPPLVPLVPGSLVVLHGKFDDPQFQDKEKMQFLLERQNSYLFKKEIISKKSSVNYLPDPFATGVTFSNLPGSGNVRAEFSQTIDTYCYDQKSQKTCADENWPEIDALEICIEEGRGQPSRVDNRITVRLPKAEKIDISYSSTMSHASLEQMALSSWIDEEYTLQGNSAAGAKLPGPDNLDKMRTVAKNAAGLGVHWMLTPSRKITLVHAVKQPLKEPVLAPVFDPSGRKETMHRDLHTTWSPMDFVIWTHGKSTSKIDVIGQWDEIAPDSNNEQGVKKTPCTQHVFQTDVHLDGSDSQTSSGGQVHFASIPDNEGVGALLCGDFIDRAVVRVRPDLSGEVKSRNPEALRIAAKLDLNNVWKNVAAVELAKIEAPRHEFTDTKHRKVAYHAVAATRFREYFLPMRGTASVMPELDPSKGAAAALGKSAQLPATDKNVEEQFMRTGPLVTVHVPSSARPSPLKVAYLVPFFGWEPQRKDGNTLSRKRKGNGIRVYFEGPWYSSGEDEMLGVVHLPDGASADEDFKQYKPYISQWGTDPIWKTAQLPATYPTTMHVAEGQDTAHRLSIPEFGESSAGAPGISATGYTVNYDKDKNLWYADVRMDPANAYFPFVRLALARYQPYSIKDTHLSPVSVADFAQLLPDRALTISSTMLPDGKVSLEVTVIGVSCGECYSEMVTTLEKADNNISDGILKWKPMPDGALTHGFVGKQHIANFEYKHRGQVILPKKEGDDKYRLVIKEHESFTDRNNKSSERLVYADAFELDQLGY